MQLSGFFFLWRIEEMSAEDQSNIMVIGDDVNFIYLMRRFVRESAHRWLYSEINEQALEIAQKERPVAIVLEADLSGSRGWDLLHALKNDPCIGKIPVMVCTWLDDEKHCLEEGADLYLRMPVLYGDFVAALKRIGVSSEARLTGSQVDKD